MSEAAPFRLKLTGDTADDHQFQGYDGYMALAGFARTLSLVANYADTGEIRVRGDFPGRHAVRATAPSEGSILVDFTVFLQNDPKAIFGVAASATSVLYALVSRVIARNVGEDFEPDATTLAQIIEQNEGDVEALVGITEAPIRQAHGIIGNGASDVKILGGGGFNIINDFNEKTKEYVKLNVEDDTEREAVVSVSAFNANSGYGSVFDPKLGHVVPFNMPRDTLRRFGPAMSWGLHQYVRKTGKRVRIRFTRILAMDGRPKRYVIRHVARAD